MNRGRLAFMGFLLLSGAVRAADEPAPEKIDAKLLAIHRDEARRWEIFVDASQTKKATFDPEPVYRWTNKSRANGQSGAMFVWTFEGRPVALGGVFSNPEAGRRVIMHELHALGAQKLFPRLTGSEFVWRPEDGVPLYALAGVPAPEASTTRRALQLRDLAREFTANTIDDRGTRWQLRMLPRPLYRYGKDSGDLIEGAVFAFVSDAGTDPEIILLLEAVNDGAKKAWRYRPVRFSISSLHVQHKGKEVWKSLRDGQTGVFDNPGNTYSLLRDRLIDELPELSAGRQP